MSHVHAFFMHTFFLFLSILSMCCVLLCSLSLSFSLSFSLSLFLIEPPYSTPTEEVHFGSEPSSRFQVILFWYSRTFSPFHIQFRDEKANTNFFENFQAHGIHPECQVILSDFANIPLPEVIRTRDWKSLLEKPMRCPVMFIQEFYSNIHDINTDVP